MFEIFTALILGIVEGVAEFLPISSTGHLILVNQFFAFDPEFTALFDVMIQLGAIAASVVYFRADLFPFLKKGNQTKETLVIWSKAFLGVLPTLVLGALFGKKIQETLFDPMVVASTLFIGGIIILVVERRKHKNTITSLKTMTYRKAFLIGCCQCFALIPGTSRSAATIIGALLFGASRTAAIEFSFLVAIPTVVAASAYSLLTHATPIDTQGFLLLSIGFLTAFVVAMGVIKVLMHYIHTNTFVVFGYYRIVLAILIFSYFLFI
jgi:undecaprenyl-diphosphatase